MGPPEQGSGAQAQPKPQRKKESTKTERVGGWVGAEVFSLPALFLGNARASRAQNVRLERTPPLHADI